jgi:hypothetical protein
MLFRQRTLTTEREWFWMTKLFNRPSAGLVVGFIALCVALGGGAYAATSHKVEYKGLSKDARLKVLPVSATNAGTNCDPTTATDYKICTSVELNTSSAFPRRVALVFNGTFNAVGGAARGECRLQQDGAALNGTAIRVEPSTHVDPGSPVSTSDKEYGDGYGINIVTTPQGGKHTYSVACNEFAGDLKVRQFQLSAETVR